MLHVIIIEIILVERHGRRLNRRNGGRRGIWEEMLLGMKNDIVLCDFSKYHSLTDV